MSTDRAGAARHPAGEQPLVVDGKERSVIADTFAGRVHVEWEKGEGAAMTPLGQLPFFIEYLKQGGLFDGWVAGCPLSLTSPNAPSKRDILGTVMLSVLAGHRRYAHITTLRCDPVNPPLLGMAKAVSEDAVRRALSKIEAEAGRSWLQEQLDYCTRPLLGEPWILDVDTTVKPLYGHQEGAVVGDNPKKPGRPWHTYTATYWPICGWCGRSRACPCESRGSSGQPARGEAFGAGTMDAIGSAGAAMRTLAAARRSGLGQRGCDQRGGAPRPGLSVQAAPDQAGQTGARAGDAG